MEKKLISELRKLTKDISPRSEWVTLNRDVLLQQINSKHKLQAQSVGFGGYVDLFNQILRQRIMEPAVMMLLVLGVFLGSSLTINAAFYSLPGDNLYPVKITLERTHVALVADQEKKVELKIEFAQKRVAEFSKIIAQNDTPAVKKRRIAAVAKEFKNNVVAVNDELAKIADDDLGNGAGGAVSIALTVSKKTEELARSFDKTAEELSEVEKSEVEEIVAEAVESAQETSDAAQQIVDDAAEEDILAEEEAIVEDGSEDGEVKGSSNEEINSEEQSDSNTSEQDGGEEASEEDPDLTVNTQSSAQDEESTEEVIEAIE